MLSLDSSISELSRVGPSLSRAFARVGVASVRDLLFYFPRRYLDFSVFKPIRDITAGETITVRGTLKTIHARPSFRGRMALCEAVISDKTGSLKVVWFNQPYLAKQLAPGDEILLSGKVERYKTLQLQNPIYEKTSEQLVHTGRVVPVYPLTDGLYNRSIQSAVRTCLPLAAELPELIPASILERFNLPDLPETIRQLHFPDREQDIERARQRIIFEEVLIQQLAVRQRQRLLEKIPAPAIPQNISLIKDFLATLPFTLTAGQKQALWHIVQDLAQSKPMNRLLEGDVGSGKTLVALLAMLETAAEGFQTCLLAPTEILAKQHYDTFSKYLLGNSALGTGLRIGLLTGKYRLLNNAIVPKHELTQASAKKFPNILIGTHALLHESAQFHNLGLVVIDEQHRFGVEQRSLLLQKNRQPHLLSMSATPIPRTLALAFYGDLAVSALTELPKGRKKIETQVIAEAQREKAYAFIKKELRTGRQAFIITPRVEESDTSQVKSVKQEFKRLSSDIFPEFKLGLLYGSMKSKDKEAAMDAFNGGALDVLVATSIIEIGIDVPNATVMLIEGAERFGLAQLHQLRGRVGRSESQSYCFLFLTDETSTAQQRLVQFAGSTDGFKLAELDLQQRGMGSLFGVNQSGFDFRFPQFLTLKALKMGREAASALTHRDPELKQNPELKALVAPLIKQIHLE